MADNVFCDICDNSVIHYFRCQRCHFGQYDVCEPCLERGHWCPAGHHRLVEFERKVERARLDPSSRRRLQDPPTSPHYTYEPLTTQEDSGPAIRLLTLHPTQLGKDPEVEMQSWPLHSAPEYEALSYCWGSVQPMKFMQLNNKKFAITPSLYSALWHLACHRKEPLTLWVDAVCINQGDDAEKSQQVSLMRDIYERASRTVVWLGHAEEEGEIHLALTMCTRMLDLHGNAHFNKMLGEHHYEVLEKMLSKTAEEAAVVDKRRRLYLRNRIRLWSDHGTNLSMDDVEGAARDALNADVSTRASYPGMEDYVGSFTDVLYATPPAPTRYQDIKDEDIPAQFRTPQFRQMLARQPQRREDQPLMEEITATRALFALPWFKRIWIVQETVMAKEVVFNIGVNKCPGWVVYAGLEIAGGFEPQLKALALDFVTVWAFRRALCRHPDHKHEKYKGKRDMVSLLKTFRMRDATDPRDKVYALLGITSDDVEQLGITIRYDRSVAETYTEVAIAILNATKDLSLLDLLKPTLEPIPNLPSWVPEWSDTRLPLSPLGGIKKPSANEDSSDKDYAATADSSASTICALKDGHLSLSGYICDIVTDAGVVMPTADVEIDIISKAYTPCRSDTMRDKIIQMGRMWKRMRERLQVYEAWEKIARVTENDADDSYPTDEEAIEVYKSTLQAGPSTPSHVAMHDFQIWRNNFQMYHDFLSKAESYPIDSIYTPHGQPGVAGIQFLMVMMDMKNLPEQPQFGCTIGRRLVRTANGYLGLVPAGTVGGDSIALLKGVKTPVIVREKDEEWVIVGLAYVHGMMNGEVWEEERCQKMTFV